ncbi:hypothetical protein HPB49_023439 [Dermacentor silvarum]|uniref:Uncharacterized protein n=1 Tax=Dermacentor silvarum TaxID=543639 RepID=A0ACB8CN66_DERSI|nr:hypothetical protein HPB49_023439 [Dermacentor silvarum]
MQNEHAAPPNDDDDAAPSLPHHDNEFFQDIRPGDKKAVSLAASAAADVAVAACPLGCLPSAAGKANFRAIEKRILDSIIGQGRYDCRIRPMGINNTARLLIVLLLGSPNPDPFLVDGPCVVRVNIYLRSISKIDDLSMEYTVQMTFREQWRDERLQYDDLGGQVRYLTLTEPDKLWKPDLFFSNEKEGHFHNIIMPNVLLRIHPNGDVLFSIRQAFSLTSL